MDLTRILKAQLPTWVHLKWEILPWNLAGGLTSNLMKDGHHGRSRGEAGRRKLEDGSGELEAGNAQGAVLNQQSAVGSQFRCNNCRLKTAG